MDNNTLTVLEIVLPALIVLGMAIYIVMKFLNYEETKERLSIDKARQEIVLPARMQAYERTILLLERIQPENLLRRVLRNNIPARSFQAELITTVRGEYEHNISQQIYISLTAWAMVKTATEETIRLITVAGTKVSANDSATELGEKILEIANQIGKFPTSMAIEHVKKEFAQYFLQTGQAKTDD